MFSLCISSVFAQQRFSAGPRVGLNLSNYWGNADNMKMRPGLTVGAFLMYSSLNHFGISADILYSQMGTHYKGPDYGPGLVPNSNLDFKQRVNYLEIPVVARYFLNLSGNFRPNVFVGPSLGIKLNAKRTDAKLNGNDAPSYNADNSNDFKDLDLGATGGFQLNWHAGNRQRFLIDARYTLGLAGVQTNLPNRWGMRNSLQNSNITLTLGYGFGVGPEYRSRYRR